MRPRVVFTVVIALLLLGAAALSDGRAGANVRSLVYVNGVPVSAFYSDGDSFRSYSGPFTGTNARLAGFNTLESFGPAHSWRDWHAYELYVNAKMATLNARRGVWHCTGEGELDTYGRVLLDCPDLAISQIRQGFAHAMSVDDTPSRPEYLRAQQEAMREGRGMWAHGIPDFVLTSLHSFDEDPDRDFSYNRMVSTRDGHSEKFSHRDVYDECQNVCVTEVHADQERVRAFARRLRQDPEVAPQIAWLSNLLLVEIVDRYARLGQVPEWMIEPTWDERGPALRPLLEGRLSAARRAGELGEPRRQQGACMVYVVFFRRYGRERPWCLRGHGDQH